MQTKIIAILILFLACSSCKPEKEMPKGDIFGKVYLYNSMQERIGISEGVKVEVIDIKTVRKVVSDSTGEYKIPGLSAGTYQFKFSKPGYSYWRVFNYLHTGGKPSRGPEAVLFERPEDFTVNNASFFVGSNNGKWIIRSADFSYAPLNSKCNFIVFASNSNKVSPFEYQFITYFDQQFELTVDSITYPINSKIYFTFHKAYKNLRREFINLQTNKKEYPVISEKGSPVYEVTLVNKN